MVISVFIDRQEIIAPIGWYAAERTNKVRLLVSVRVTFLGMIEDDDLANTLDYTRLSTLLIECAQKPQKLLETYGKNIIQHIKADYPKNLQQIWVRIAKKSIDQIQSNAEGYGIELKEEYA